MNKQKINARQGWIAVIFCLFTFDVIACSCMRPMLIENWNDNQHVFIAEITDIEVIEQADPQHHRSGKEHGYFEIRQVFKGSPELVTHLAAANKPICCNCSTKLQAGTYLVFANETGEKRLTSCSTSRPVKWLSYHLEVLQMLKAEIAPIRYSGIYDRQLGTFLIEDELRTTVIHEYASTKQGNKLYLDIEAYPLNNGDLFLVNIHSETAVK
ncbi:hypothetical protein [Thalassotalea mangrovi]|uniref:Uncharacterized protein n=1 Tax=Thalassotalea mangrovi TaxID=2572245 RepID=A0A4U1B317_9GAMM|nr:hypothetical protein [Thalassotalea mangrovi]TKB43645.1 hypothetical protein E8M12_14335 [Thalassotalea mangrovi]